MNIPPTIAFVVSRRLATLHELQTIYGLNDLYDLLEIATIDDHNASLNKAE